MAKEKKITLPTHEDEQLLNSVMENEADYVEAGGRKYRISWLKKGTTRKLTKIMLKKGNDDKITCQGAALIILNDILKIALFYPVLWRWFYYVKQYGDEELMPIIVAGKKKIPVDQYLAATIFLTVMKDTIMTMTKAEAERILREQNTGGYGK